MANEALIRGISFFFIFTLIAYGETVTARRQLTDSKPKRWFNNLSMIILSNILIKLTLPVAATGIAAAAVAHNWGVFNTWQVPNGVAIIISILILDLVVYLQHLMFHAVPILWRLHMVHHTDLDLDVTSALRIHPIELIISLGIKIIVVAALGMPVLAVLIFEIILNAAAMFNHANLYLPEKVDRWLRLLIVTPDMHRVHHSVIIRETNSNFGFNLPWWDWICGTYRAQPVAGHTGMTIGLSQFRVAKQLTLPKLLLLPVTGKIGPYTLKDIGRSPETKK